MQTNRQTISRKNKFNFNKQRRIFLRIYYYWKLCVFEKSSCAFWIVNGYFYYGFSSSLSSFSNGYENVTENDDEGEMKRANKIN